MARGISRSMRRWSGGGWGGSLIPKGQVRPRSSAAWPWPGRSDAWENMELGHCSISSAHWRLDIRQESEFPRNLCKLCHFINEGFRRRKKGKIVAFCQTPLGPHPRFGLFSEKKLTHYFLGKINHWSLYLLLLYQFHLAIIGPNLISAHWDQYITLH